MSLIQKGWPADILSRGVRPTAADAFDEARGFFAFEDRPVKEPGALWQRMGSFDFTLFGRDTQRCCATIKVRRKGVRGRYRV
jgi:hypothetical protein